VENGHRCEFTPAVHYGVTWTAPFKKKLTEFLRKEGDLESSYGLLADPPAKPKKKRWRNDS
jgi:hypothetical protein